MRLKDKSAIVTGGGGGIGRSICVHFAREGARVMISDINLPAAEETVHLIRKAGGKARAFKTDITKEEDVRAMAA